MGDSDLYIFKTDVDGRRIGSIVPAVENTSDRTNDMMFCTDGDLLYLAYFRPVTQSIVHILDQNLRQVRSPLVTSLQLPHNNLGGMTCHEGKFYMFTGDRYGPNSNLIVTIWNHDWTPAQSQPRILIPAPAGGGYFFGSGIAFDKASSRWMIGFHHILNSDPDASTHLDLAVFIGASVRRSAWFPWNDSANPECMSRIWERWMQTPARVCFLLHNMCLTAGSGAR